MPITIYPRGKIWHYRGTVNGRRLRGSCKTTCKVTAQRIASKAETRAWKNSLDGPKEVLTFAQAAMLYRAAGKSTRFLEPIEDHWKNTLVKNISKGAIRQSAITLYPNVKGSTRNRQVIVPTQAIINHAAEMELCNSISVKRFKETRKIKEPATLDWVTKFVEHASPHMGAMCLFMFGTGARISEAINLRWADLDLSGATALIRQTKISEERLAHLQPALVAAIANIKSNRNGAEKVFRYSSRDSAREVWNAVIKRAKIQHLSYHSCRHGFATTMLHNGVDVVTVAKMGGWKDVTEVVKTYGHAMRDNTITNVIFDTNLTQLKSIDGPSDCKQTNISNG